MSGSRVGQARDTGMAMVLITSFCCTRASVRVSCCWPSRFWFSRWPGVLRRWTGKDPLQLRRWKRADGSVLTVRRGETRPEDLANAL